MHTAHNPESHTMNTEHPRLTIDHSDIAEAVNHATNYTMYAVFAHRIGAPDPSTQPSALTKTLEGIPGLTIRGWYDVSGFRADADLLIWMHAPDTDALQQAYREVLDWSAGKLTPVWSNIGVHRAAEFNRAHIPGFLAGETPGAFVCVYPFVRSDEWYLIDEAERGRMLREHGVAAKDYPDVIANTVASFALGDYEWLLAFEADELIRLVDLMRELRAVDARRYVVEEVPFFTGPRRDAETLLSRLTTKR